MMHVEDRGAGLAQGFATRSLSVLFCQQLLRQQRYKWVTSQSMCKQHDGQCDEINFEANEVSTQRMDVATHFRGGRSGSDQITLFEFRLFLQGRVGEYASEYLSD